MAVALRDSHFAILCVKMICVFVMLRKSVRYVKLIADAPYCLECPLVRETFKLVTQALYVHVYCTGVSEVVKAPYFVKKLISCENSVAVGS